MTWRFRILSDLPVALIALSIIGIAGGLALPPASQPAARTAATSAPGAIPPCVQLVVTALTSLDREVAGAFACLTAERQFGAAAGGYDGDAGMRKFAQDNGRSRYRLVEVTPEGQYVFELSGHGVQSVEVFFFLDGSGKVDRIDAEPLGS